MRAWGLDLILRLSKHEAAELTHYPAATPLDAV